jgi:hypothetical protein
MFSFQLCSSTLLFEKNLFRFIRPLFNSKNNNFSILSSSTKYNIEPEKALEQFIIDRIRSTGPISISEYMKLCVSSQYGYYAQKVFQFFIFIIIIIFLILG